MLSLILQRAWGSSGRGERGQRAVGREKGHEERLRDVGSDSPEVSEGGETKSIAASARVGTAVEVLSCSFHYTR